MINIDWDYKPEKVDEKKLPEKAVTSKQEERIRQSPAKTQARSRQNCN